MFDLAVRSPFNFLADPFWGMSQAKSWEPRFTASLAEGGSYIVEMEVPGIGPGDIHIGADAVKVCVKAENGTRSYNFVRRFPFQIDVDAVKAKVENGILTIEVPRLDKNTARKIEVQS